MISLSLYIYIDTSNTFNNNGLRQMCSHELAVTLLEPAGTFLPSWNLAGTFLGTLLELCWNLTGTLPEPCCNFPTAILLGFNLWGGEWCQQNACSGKPEHYWNLARTSLEYCWNSAGRLLEHAGTCLVGTLLESRWNLAGTLLELSWNLPGLGETWNLAGKSLEHCWNEPLLECGEALLEPRWNLVAGTPGWNILLGTNAGVDFVFL